MVISASGSVLGVLWQLNKRWKVVPVMYLAEEQVRLQLPKGDCTRQCPFWGTLHPVPLLEKQSEIAGLFGLYLFLLVQGSDVQCLRA